MLIPGWCSHGMGLVMVTTATFGEVKRSAEDPVSGKEWPASDPSAWSVVIERVGSHGGQQQP